MLVTCPSCQSAYRFSDEAIGDGRMVRCARCTTQWFAAPPPVQIMALEDAAAIEVVGEDMPPAPASEPTPSSQSRRPPRQKKPARKRRTEPLKPHLAFAAAGLLALGLLVFERVEVVRLAPSLASIYRVAGLAVNTRGLDIREVKSVEQLEEGSPLLLVTGAIANVTREPVAVPRLRLAVMTSDDRELYAWTTVSARAELGPGETTQFRARLASPPADGQRVEVRFLSRRDIMARSSY